MMHHNIFRAISLKMLLHCLSKVSLSASFQAYTKRFADALCFCISVHVTVSIVPTCNVKFRNKTESIHIGPYLERQMSHYLETTNGTKIYTHNIQRSFIDLIT